MTYLPELLTAKGSYPLTDHEANVLYGVMLAMRGKLERGEPAVKLLTANGDMYAAGMVEDGVPIEVVADILGVGVSSVKGAIRRVRNGRYG